MRPVKKDYEVGCLADSHNGFLRKIQIYYGKEKKSSDSEKRLGERVVLKLTELSEGRNCLVAFANFFTSVSVLEKLYE